MRPSSDRSSSRRSSVSNWRAEPVGLARNPFHEQHEARFGFRLVDHMEIVNFLVTGSAQFSELGTRDQSGELASIK